MQPPEGFGRYAAATAFGLALSLLLISAFFVSVSRSLADNLLTALFTAWFFWVPVGVFALVPGWWIFRGIRRAYRTNRAERLMGLVLASVAVALVAAGGAVAALWIWTLLTGMLDGNDLGEVLIVMLLPGVPAAVVSGLVFYGRKASRAA